MACEPSTKAGEDVLVATTTELLTPALEIKKLRESWQSGNRRKDYKSVICAEKNLARVV
jgi:hypothetical protein